MKGISYPPRACSLRCKSRHTHRSMTGATPFEAACVSKLESSLSKSSSERKYNSKVVRWTMSRKMVVGILVMAMRERVLSVDECMIFKRASFISLLKLFQFQGCQIISRRATTSEKHSRQQNGSRRMASSDVLFIHCESESELAFRVCPLRVMVLTKD